MTPLEALRDLTSAAAGMIDWLQGYEVPDPLESLAGAVVRAREAIRVAEDREWHPSDVKGIETRLDEHGYRHWRTIR